MPAFTFSPTPNPNSMKITTDAAPFIEQGMVSFDSPEEAAEHPIGRHIFGIPGVMNVFALPQFVTVTKHPAAKWNDVLPKLEGALNAYFEELGRAA